MKVPPDSQPRNVLIYPSLRSKAPGVFLIPQRKQLEVKKSLLEGYEQHLTKADLG